MKKTLLTLCAGLLAMSASAQQFAKGEALAYTMDNNFQWFEGDEEFYNQNDNWPAEALRGQADMAQGWGLGMFWFAQYNAGTPGPVAEKNTLEDALQIVPIVADPWDEESTVAMVKATGWWAFGNLNFALPQTNEVSRIRMIYRVDASVKENPYAGTEPNPFKLWLTNEAQDQCFETPRYFEDLNSYWDNGGWRVVDLYYNLTEKTTYLAMTFMPGGLTTKGAGIPFYLKQVSIVPVSKLPGDTHQSGDVEYNVVSECPELVTVGGEGAINEISVASKAAEGIYDLQGRKVAKAEKGLYIINGVKTLVK